MVNSNDVARAAGTSQATVSRVFRGLAVRPATAQRVRDAAAELGYRPSGAARALISGRSRQVALVVETLRNPSFAILADTVHTLLRRRGYRLSIVTSDPDAHGLVDLPDETFESVDAIMYASVDNDLPTGEAIASLGRPTLLLVRSPGTSSFPALSPPHAAAAELAVDHLWALGHRRLAMVGASRRVTSGAERATGFRDALLRRGVASADIAVHEGEMTYESGYDEVARLLAVAAPPTGIVAADDLVGFGACAAVVDAGLRVGEDVSVVGIDDLWMSAWPTFALTTVDIGWAELVTRAVDQIIEMIDRPDAAVPGISRVGTPRLVVRSTTGPAPQAR